MASADAAGVGAGVGGAVEVGDADGNEPGVGLGGPADDGGVERAGVDVGADVGDAIGVARGVGVGVEDGAGVGVGRGVEVAAGVGDAVGVEVGPRMVTVTDPVSIPDVQLAWSRDSAGQVYVPGPVPITVTWNTTVSPSPFRTSPSVTAWTCAIVEPPGPPDGGSAVHACAGGTASTATALTAKAPGQLQTDAADGAAAADVRRRQHDLSSGCLRQWQAAPRQSSSRRSRRTPRPRSRPRRSQPTPRRAPPRQRSAGAHVPFRYSGNAAGRGPKRGPRLGRARERRVGRGPHTVDEQRDQRLIELRTCRVLDPP